MRLGALVLAAGGSVRLGQPKQLLLYRDQPLVRCTVAAALAAGCAPVVVVVGRDHLQIEAALKDLPVTLLSNDNWERGMGSSIRLGVQALEDCSALLILGCDQPHVSADLIRRLRATQEGTGKPIVASAYAATTGTPALFARPYFPDLLALPAAQGAKIIITVHPQDVATVDFPEGAVDIDTPDDYRNLPNNS